MDNLTQTSTPGGAAKPLRVGDLLVDLGIITPEQVDQALAYQRDKGHKKLLGEVLIELGFVTEEQVAEVLAQGYGVPFARINPRVADAKVIELLPRDFLEKNTVLPLFLARDKLTVAVAEPSNVFMVEEIERLAGKPVQIVAATTADIRSTLESYMPDGNVFVIDEMIEDIDASDLSVVESQITDLTNLEDASGESPVIKLANYLIYAAVQEGASDIHLEPDDGQSRVRYRVDGRLFEKLSPPYQMHAALVSRIKIMAGLDISERRVPQDGGITIRVDKRQVDLRVSTCPGKFGEKVVMRVIDKTGALLSLEKIGFAPDMLEEFRTLVHQPNGVVLVTGPTGSGKSTTLYAALSEINDEAVNISTVEDPVEFNLPGINQFQTNDKAGFTFAGALRSLLRQDPDVVMLGEIRDQETAKIATQAALTGHLVLSTLHTNDAVSAVTRLINVGVESYLIAASIRGVLAQRLLRKVCPNCKEEQTLDPTVRKTLERMFPDTPLPEKVYHGAGCSRCRNTGYAGRIGIYELYVPDDEGLDAISRDAPLQELRRMALASGKYTTLRADGLEKVAAGLTTVDELIRATTA